MRIVTLIVLSALVCCVGCGESADNNPDGDMELELVETDTEEDISEADIYDADIIEAELDSTETDNDGEFCTDHFCDGIKYYRCHEGTSYLLSTCKPPYICDAAQNGCVFSEQCGDNEPVCDTRVDFWWRLFCVDGLWVDGEVCEPTAPCKNGFCIEGGSNANYDLFKPCTHGCPKDSGSYAPFAYNSCEPSADGDDDLEEFESDAEEIWCGRQAPYCIDGQCLVCPPNKQTTYESWVQNCNDRGTNFKETMRTD